MFGAYTVFLRELLLLRKKLPGFFAGSMVGPLLYLMAFGWGLGRNIQLGGVNYLDFVVPGIVAVSAMNGSYNATGTSLNISRLYHRTFEEFLVAPIGVWSIVLGNVLGGCMRGLFSSTVILIMSFFFGARLHYNFWLIIALFLTCFLFASLGVVAAMVVNSHEDMANFGTFFILPMSFLCGTFFQVDVLPPIVSQIIMLLPLTHSAISIRAIALGAGFPLTSLLVMAGYAIVLFRLGIWVTYKAE
ncbi:MAG: ABC transporter permease [Firmicutes bacterium]|nr:ABC transporter permease [Bacillota bacterium]